MKKTTLVAACAFAALAPAARLFAEENAEASELEHLEETQERRWLRFSAFADVETAYICRGYVWDTRPYSAQAVDAEIDFGEYGRLDTFIWTMSAMSGSGNSSRMSHYAYAEVDYLLRYSYDINIAEGWRLQNTVARMWISNNGYRGGHTLCDWRAMQVLHNPYITPYWLLRYIRQPRQSEYWCLGVKHTFENVIDRLDFTIDFFGDFGDHRHFTALYGPKDGKPHSKYSRGLQALNLVFRADYRLMEHVGLFAFIGQFALVHDDARDAIKASNAKEAKRDLTYGGIGIAVDF